MLITQEAILARVTPEPNSGCWLWLAGMSSGYGVLSIGGQCIAAHRASYIAFKEPIPSGFVICHTCDNPPCANPDHLWAGTHEQNMADMVAKGRVAARCDNGHPFTPGRACLVCARDRREADLSRWREQRKLDRWFAGEEFELAIFLLDAPRDVASL